MNILNKIYTGALLASATVLGTGCEQNRYDETNVIEQQIEKRMSDRPYGEFQKATSGWRKGLIGTADAQSTLDSVAYRQVFDSTQVAKDSAKVAEFNKIAASMRVPQNIKKPQPAEDALFDKLKNAKTEDALKLKRETTIVYTYNLPAKQHIADSVAYNDFFKNNGLLNEQTKKILKKVEEEIRPVYKYSKYGSSLRYIK